MITRIELTNFMSHVHTVIEPAAGLTVLVGPNNCGKSAVVAALQILCRNDNSTYVLRHGERECSVTVVCDDGHTIEWRRKTSPSYRIDGQTFDRLGRGNSGLPDELHQALRLPKVDAVDDSDFDVHFGAQKSPIFLLGSSSANAARFFASSSDAIRLVQMQKRHKDKLQNAQREKNHLEAESLRVNAELAALEPAVDLDRRIKQLEAEHSKLLQLGESIAGTAQIIEALKLQSGVIARHAAEAQAFSNLHPPPALAPTAGLEKLLADLPAAKHQRETRAAEAVALAPLAAPPTFFDVKTFEATCAKIRSLEKAVAAGTARRHSLLHLAPAPRFEDTNSLEMLVTQLIAAGEKTQAAAGQAEALGVLSLPPPTADVLPLSRLLQNMAKCEQDVARHQTSLDRLFRIRNVPTPSDATPLAESLRKLEEANNQLHACTREVQKAAAALDEAAAALRAEAAGSLCPICSTPLDPERLLASTAAGGRVHAHG